MEDFLNLQDRLSTFYQSERKQLESHYPGITFSRLKSELETFLQNVCLRSDKQFIHLSIAGENDDVDYFFIYLKEGMPLEYISGRAFFYNSEFRVSPDVLIPRFESEILVEKACHQIRQISAKTICDVGTGSGALLITMLQEIATPLEAKGIDISPEALEVAKQNAFELAHTYSPKHKISWEKGDKLRDVNEKFDVIVSNPPYIRDSEADSGVHIQVAKYEPKRALYLADDEYDQWFKEFYIQVREHLTQCGEFFMEGHENELQNLAQGWSHSFPQDSIQVIKDLAQKDRLLWVQKKG